VSDRREIARQKLRFSFHVPYFLQNEIDHWKLRLNRLIEVAEATDMPILIGLDGFELWAGRPDLWNWWAWSAIRPVGTSIFSFRFEVLCPVA
jgi:hypothetical protein